MKKFALAAAVLATVAFASCGNKEAENNDSLVMEDTAVLVEETVDTANGDTTVEAAVVTDSVVAPAEAAQ